MGRGFSIEERQYRLNEMHRSLSACHGADAIVFNLFACEGWFIAQYLGVPCIAASPFAITRLVCSIALCSTLVCYMHYSLTVCVCSKTYHNIYTLVCHALQHHALCLLYNIAQYLAAVPCITAWVTLVFSITLQILWCAMYCSLTLCNHK